MSDKSSSIDILGASAGDLAGAALVGKDDYGVHVSTVNVGCRFAGPCTELPFGGSWGTQSQGDVPGLKPGTYDLVILGRPGARVSLRLRNALAGHPLRFRTVARHQVREMVSLYPATSDQMPEAYFDEQLAGAPGKAVTVLIGHLEAARPKTLQFSSCLRRGVAPAIHVPRYGSGCLGDSDGDESPSGTFGAVSVGGQDCSTVPPPVCVPVTTHSFHVSFAKAQVFSVPPHVSLTADILALKSNVRASAITFRLP